MNVEILRIKDLLNDGTRGALRIEGRFQCYTLELPWKDNQKDISCIPLGNYVCSKVKNVYTRHGSLIPVTFEIKDVPNRSGVLFHAGNFLTETLGCVLLGEAAAHGPSVLSSGLAFAKFLETLDTEIFNLCILEA